MEVSEAEGLIDIAVWPRDLHSGVATSSLRLYHGTSSAVGTEVTAEFTGDAFSDQMIYELDTTSLDDGNYVLKMTITDNVGLSSTVYKDFTIHNPIAAPIVSAAMDSGNAQLSVNWSYEQAMSDLSGLQYSLDGSETWNNISVSNTQQGAFQVTLPEGTSGSHYISVRAIDTDGNPSESVRTDFTVDSAIPVVQITSIERGIVSGTVSDDNLNEWTISAKVKDSADEYTDLSSGSTVIENGRIGVADLSAASFASDTWYTVRVQATDVNGNISYDTYDVYKDSSYVSAYVIPSANWILRGLGQSRQEKNFIISAEQNTLKLNGSSGLSSAAWFFNNQLAGSTVDYSADFSTYTEGTEAKIAAAAKKTDGSVVLSSDVYMNAVTDTFAFGTSTTSEIEKQVTLSQNAAAFILDAPATFTSEVSAVPSAEEENEEAMADAAEAAAETVAEADVETTSETTEVGITYYAKAGDGTYQQITPGEAVYIYGLNDQMISADAVTIKAVAADGTALGNPGSFSLHLGIMEEETFSVSSSEIYWPEELTVADKVNYKTYLTWTNEANRPETVYYQVYRSTFAGFEPNELTMVADHVTDNYWVDINLNYGTDLYYRVRAVTVDASGNMVSVSRYSNEVVSRAIDENEYTKNLGHQEYWAYADVATPAGSGYIEKSQGNFLYEQTDAEVANEKLPVDITRTYNSMATSKSIFGYGWTFTYDMEILRLGYSNDLSSGSLVLRDGNGTIYRFKESGGTYISSLGKYVDLSKADLTETIVLPVREGENQGREVTVASAYTMTTRDGIEYRFNSSGKLIYMKEDNGNQLFFEYDENKGVLTRITTGNNIEIQMNYQTEAEGDAYLVNEIILPDGQKVAYSYDSSSHLTGVTKYSRPNAETGSRDAISYAYAYTSGKLRTLSDGRGNIYTIGYASAADGIANSFTYPAAGNSRQEVIHVTRDAATGNATTTKVVGGQEVTRAVDSFSGTGICIQHEDYSGEELLKSVSYEYKDNLLMKMWQNITYDELQITTDAQSGATSAAIVTIPVEKIETYTYTEDETVKTETATDGAVGTYTYGNTGKYSYLPTEYRETVTDEDGETYNVVHEAYVYDSHGNLTKLTDYINQTVTAYTYFNDVSDKAKGAIASETTYTCDEQGNYTESNKTSYSSTSYSYGEDGSKTEIVTNAADGNTTVTTTVYDVMGNVISEVITATSSNGKKNRESHTYTLDGFGRIISTTTVKELLNSDGSVQAGTTSTTTETKTYDANSTVATETGADGIQKTYTYDALNRVTSILEKNTATGEERYTATTYDYADVTVNTGKTEQKVWSDTLVTTQTVKASAAAATGDVTSVSYQNGLGQVVRQTAYGVTTDYTYDGNGNRIAEYVITDSDTNAGRLTYHVYDKEGRETATVYNPVYNEATDSFHVGTETIYESTVYDEAGNVVQTTDGEGNVTKHTYDEAGRLVKVSLIDETGSPVDTTFTYQTVNVSENTSYELVTMTNAKNAVSTEKTDSSGNVIEISDRGISGEAGIQNITTSYNYDANGNLLKEIRGTGTIEYTYNSRNLVTRKVQKDSSGSPVYMTEYTYVDGSDLVSCMEDYRYENGSAVKYRHTEYTYDGLNRLKTFAEMNTSLESPDTTGYRITYIYDFNDNITEIAYGSALDSEVDKVKYSYTNNQLMRVSVTIGNTDYIVKEYTYNQDGSTENVKDYYNFKAGTSTYLNLAYTYDALGRVSDMLYTKEDGTIVERHSYEYDKNNNIVREVNENALTGLHESRTYTYDYSGQLKESIISNITTTTSEISTGEVDDNGVDIKETKITVTETPYLTTAYTYDSVGNRLTKVENGSTTTYTYNGLNQLVTETGNGTLTYGYDSNGNQISITGGDAAKYFTYTPSGMLASYTCGSDSQTNLYNGEGQRVQKTEGSDVTNYFYQQGSVLYTTDGSGELKAFNLLNVSDAFATSRVSGTAENYYFYTEDQRGSTVNVLDSNGNRVVSYWYSDFGEVIEDKASGYTNFVNEIQYTGAIYDELTGLLYLNARFYDPSTGRFITQDTYRGERNNADTWHLYAYCANNPINMVDPSGHKFIRIRRDIAAIGLDIAFTVLLPTIAGTYDIWGMAIKGTIRKFSKSQIGKKNIMFLWDDWINVKAKSIVRWMSTYDVKIRTAIRRATGITVANSYSTGITKVLTYYARRKPKVEEAIDILTSAMSLGGAITFILAELDDVKGRDYIYFRV